MIDLKPTVLQALEGSVSLAALLATDPDGNLAVYQLVAPHADAFPRITFFEMGNRDSAYSDDDACESRITMQIDIWSKGETAAIGAEVDRTMKGLGFRRTSSADLYEDDTEIYHKGIRYTIEVEPE